MIDKIAKGLAALGAINWGLVAFFGFNLVEKIAQFAPAYNIDKIAYGLVAASGIYLIYTFKK